MSDPSGGTGKAILMILENNNNIQVSNYGDNSFKLENAGSKRIAAVFIDVTNAIFRDVVFDNNGSGGDSVAKKLKYDSNEAQVGAISIDKYQWLRLPARNGSFNPKSRFDPNNLSDVNNLFVDETSNNNLGSPKAGGGFRGELLLFSNFDPGDSVGFSGDMDPNSIAGLTQGTVYIGWDVGGVSGAEMANSVVSVLFGDGSIASGTIAADGSQAGGIAVISSDLMGPPGLTVNGLGPGGTGTYNSANPTVVVSASPGSTVRISLVEGFDPATASGTVANNQITVNNLVAARLQAQYPEFPVNNAKNWQHKQVQIPGSGSLTISGLFSYVTKLPVAFTAVIIGGNGQPVSKTTVPIYLRYSSGATPPSPTPPSPTPPSPTASAPTPALPNPLSPTPQGVVAKFELYNADTDTKIRDISNGSIISTSETRRVGKEAATK